VNHTALEYVKSKVPNATFDDATDVVGFVRYVKSAEEIAFVRESAQVASAGLDELIKLARPGVDAGILYSDVLARLLELRSEYFPLTLSIDSIGGQKPKRYVNPPIGRRLKPHDLISGEISAIRGAQWMQVCQPILLGQIPAEWKPVIDAHKEVYEAGLAMIKPGMTFGALSDFATGFGPKRGMKTVMQLQGCGYGDDGPLFTAKVHSDRVRDLPIEKGNVFVWKPLAMSVDAKIQFSFGGPVIVGERSCETLFKRARGLVEIV